MPLRDTLLCLLAIVIWAGNLIAIKLSIGELSPLTALAVRFGLAALVFLPFARWPGKESFLVLLQIGLLMGFIHQGLLFVGMAHLGAGITAVLLQAQVIFSVLIGWLVFKEHMSLRAWAGIILGIAGIGVITGLSGQGTASLTGVTMLIASTFVLALAYMRMKQLKPVRPATFLFGINALPFPFVLAASLLLEPGALAVIPQADWGMLSLVLGFQIVFVGASHILWQRLLSRNPLSLVTPFTLLLPVFGMAMAFVMLNETIDLRTLLGAALTVAGVSLIVLRRRPAAIKA